MHGRVLASARVLIGVLGCGVAAGAFARSSDGSMTRWIDGAIHVSPQDSSQRPVFRSGANLILVDAYPQRDGRIVEGLTTADFEIIEDGKPQKIENLEFVRVEPAQVEGARRDPNTIAEMRAAAANPHNRVFITYLDGSHTTPSGSRDIRTPLIDTINRVVGPDDLFGVMTQQMRPQDLTLARRLDTVSDQLQKYWTWGVKNNLTNDARDPIEDDLKSCFEINRGTGKPWFVSDGPDVDTFDKILIQRRREDRALKSLENLVAYLPQMRDARTVLLVISDGWLILPANTDLIAEVLNDPRAATAGVAPRPAAPGRGAPITGPGPLQVRVGDSDYQTCMAEATRLLSLDNPRRFRDLMTAANRANVSVYPIASSGLTVFDDGGVAKQTPGRPINLGRDADRVRNRVEALQTIAENTDGIAVVNTNDLAKGLKRIVDDVSAYYLLGYYSTNPTLDGKLRRIDVKVTPPGLRVHARRGYLAVATASSAAPTSSASSAIVDALAVLDRVRETAEVIIATARSATGLDVVVELPSRLMTTGGWLQGGTAAVEVSGAAGGEVGTARGAIDPGSRSVVVRVPLAGGSGPWRVRARVQGTSGTVEDAVDVPLASMSPVLLGEPIAFRAAPSPRAVIKPVADFAWHRTERAHFEWPRLRDLDQRAVRVLDRRGQPLPVPTTLTERDVDGRPTVAADVTLGPLSDGDYLVELVVGSGATTERALVAIRVVR